MKDTREKQYACEDCEGKRFQTLSGLRMHSAIAHSKVSGIDTNRDTITSEEAMESRKQATESRTLDDMPDTIDKIFERFNRKAEMLLRKYDRRFADIEEELELSGKLRMIKKRKEKLKSDLEQLEGPTRVPKYKTEDPSYSSNNEQEKDDVSEKELSSRNQTNINNAAKNRNSEAFEKKLELSVQLAAKYKEQAIVLENKLQHTARSEQNLRYYLQNAAEKEAEAKKRLEEFITGLIERAEKAEEKVKSYKSQLSSYGPAVRKQSFEKRDRSPRSASTLSSAPMISLKPPTPRTYSSSTPTPPPLLQSGPKRHRKNSLQEPRDDYVTQILEPPSSQELPRRWHKAHDRSVDQLPGVDMSKLIDFSSIWPFAITRNSLKTTRSGDSSSMDNSSLRFDPSGHYNDASIKRRIVLFCVFAYMDTETLLRCSLVSREWRDVSKHPKLWTRVSLDSKHINSEFLATLSAWCKETCYLSFNNIKGRSRYPGETSNEYREATIGSLEDGMECLLQACGKNLVVLSISKCDPFLTRRVVWMASCYNRELKSLTFRSCEPLNPEVTWSLGSGCQKLLSLDIAPLKTCKTPEVFNNRVLQMVSWCWPKLRGLSVGGRCIDKKGLLSIATNCRNLQVLELMHMNEITEDLAKEIVKKGLNSLRSLILTHTPIRTRALSCLLRLASENSLGHLRVQLSFSDYCPTEGDQPPVIMGDNLDRSELFEAFNSVMQSLVRLQKKPMYKGVLEVICTA